MTASDSRVRAAQETAVRMVAARNAVRAKILAAQAEPSAQARLAVARRQYEALREGAREALDKLAALVAKDAD